MAQRLELQALFIDLLGSKNVYFQPPTGFLMDYPCIVYKLSVFNTKFADNDLYNYTRRYQVTYIDRDADSEMIEKLLNLPMCSFDRFFTAENLNHYAYNLFF